LNPTTHHNDRPSALYTILGGGLIAATLDGLDAVIFYKAAMGVPPYRIFQHIAGGLLGPNTFNGGNATVVLGIFLHTLIAVGAATVFYFASLRLPMLHRRPWIFGPAFGIVVYLVMHYLVVPLSAIPPHHSSMGWPEFLDQIFAHTCLVGLPIALAASRSARANA
jgi:uncharacterized membrane protein YagU involved in acid resistance